MTDGLRNTTALMSGVSCPRRGGLQGVQAPDSDRADHAQHPLEGPLLHPQIRLGEQATRRTPQDPPGEGPQEVPAFPLRRGDREDPGGPPHRPAQVAAHDIYGAPEGRGPLPTTYDGGQLPSIVIGSRSVTFHARDITRGSREGDLYLLVFSYEY